MKALVLVLGLLAASQVFAADQKAQGNRTRVCHEGARSYIYGYMDSTMEAPVDLPIICKNGQWVRL